MKYLIVAMFAFMAFAGDIWQPSKSNAIWEREPTPVNQEWHNYPSPHSTMHVQNVPCGVVLHSKATHSRAMTYLPRQRWNPNTKTLEAFLPPHNCRDI